MRMYIVTWQDCTDSLPGHHTDTLASSLGGVVMAIPGKDERLTPYGSTNLGMDLSLIDSLIVPNEMFFVRSNGEIPHIAAEEWTLVVDGAVERPQTIDFETLTNLPAQTVTSFLECTGNGRSRFSPTAEGTPWLNDAAGNADWHGVSLAAVLDLAQPTAGAVDVVTQGADLASMRRGLPLHVAMDPDVLLVYEMNGEPLPAAHGYPVRLLVPGWAGIASTKWLTRLEVLDHPFTGEFQGDLYVVYDEDGVPVAPISQMPVKSVIQTPKHGASLPIGPHLVRMYAWSGMAGIEKVEVTIDSGKTWIEAEVREEDGAQSWSSWEAVIDLPAGRHTISARATDMRRLQQPWKARWNQKGYLMNEIHSVQVEAR